MASVLAAVRPGPPAPLERAPIQRRRLTSECLSTGRVNPRRQGDGPQNPLEADQPGLGRVRTNLAPAPSGPSPWPTTVHHQQEADQSATAPSVAPVAGSPARPPDPKFLPATAHSPEPNIGSWPDQLGLTCAITWWYTSCCRALRRVLANSASWARALQWSAS